MDLGKKHSTALAVIEVIDTIRSVLDRKEYAIGIFLDLEKAFDTISHPILLRKLDHYGFRGHINTFIKSYLTGRKQYTRANSTNSLPLEINNVVHQGSILRPLLFLIFINDISNALTNCSCKLFADDTSIILHHRNKDILIKMPKHHSKK